MECTTTIDPPSKKLLENHRLCIEGKQPWEGRVAKERGVFWRWNSPPYDDTLYCTGCGICVPCDNTSVWDHLYDPPLQRPQ